MVVMRKILIIVFACLVFILLGGAGYYFYLDSVLRSKPKNTSPSASSSFQFLTPEVLKTNSGEFITSVYGQVEEISPAKLRRSKVKEQKVARAKELRLKMTPAERILWQHLQRNHLEDFRFSSRVVAFGRRIRRKAQGQLITVAPPCKG